MSNKKQNDEINFTNENLRLSLDEIKSVKHFENADDNELENIREIVYQFAIILYKTREDE